MGKPVLVIGSKSVSSWSLRPWLFLRHHGVAFDECVIELDRPDTRARILEYSPTGRVPVLLHDAVTVWESLAICDYAVETFALPLAWPLDPARRALARALAHEMHAGFSDLRRELPFAPTRAPGKVPLSDKAAADVARVCSIWRACRREHARDGEWLFGRFGIVDAMFAPVALRFQSYAIELDLVEREYQQSVMTHPAVREWIDAAHREVSRPAAAAGAAAAPAPARTVAQLLEQQHVPVPPQEEDLEATQPVLRTLLEMKEAELGRPFPIPAMAQLPPQPRAAAPEAPLELPLEMPPSRAATEAPPVVAPARTAAPPPAVLPLEARLEARAAAAAGLAAAEPLSEPVLDLPSIPIPKTPSLTPQAKPSDATEPPLPPPGKIRSVILPP